MKKQTGLFSGSVIFLAAALINYAVRFLISIIIARSLGLDGKGIYALIITTGSLFTLIANPGLGAATTYLTASQKADQEKLVGVIVVSHLASSLLGGVVLAGAYFLILRTTLLNGITLLQLSSILVYFPTYLLTILLNARLLGNQHIIQANITDVGRGVSNLLLQIGSWVLGFGINGAISAWLVANVISLGIAVFFSRNSLSASFSDLKPIGKTALKYGLKSYIANLLTFFNYRLDTFLVNMFTSFSQVGLYTTGVAIAELIYFIPNAFSAALFPKIPKLDLSDAGQLTARLSRFLVVAVSLAAILFAFVGEKMIILFYSEVFRAAAKPLLLLLPGMLGVSITKILSAHLSGIGKPEYAARTAGLTVIITIIGDIVFIPQFGILGAAGVSSVAYLVGAILMSVWFIRETGIPWQEFILPKYSDITFLGRYLRSLLEKIPFEKSSS